MITLKLHSETHLPFHRRHARAVTVALYVAVVTAASVVSYVLAAGA